MRRIRHAKTTAAAALGTLAVLAGCAHQAPAPVAVSPLPPPVPPRPAPPGIAAGLAIPARAPDGNYETINRGIDAAQALWHVRAALNVAALGCRGPDEAALIASYNGLLKAHKAPLAAANTAVMKSYRQQFGARWQQPHDVYMTRLYNFFSQPWAQRAFCPTAAAVIADAQTVPAAGLTGWAPAALARLEAPFTDFYRRWEAYKVDLAAWEARYGPGGSGQPLLAYAALAPDEALAIPGPGASPVRLAAASERLRAQPAARRSPSPPAPAPDYMPPD